MPVADASGRFFFAKIHKKILSEKHCLRLLEAPAYRNTWTKDEISPTINAKDIPTLSDHVFPEIGSLWFREQKESQRRYLINWSFGFIWFLLPRFPIIPAPVGTSLAICVTLLFFDVVNQSVIRFETTVMNAHPETSGPHWGRRSFLSIQMNIVRWRFRSLLFIFKYKVIKFYGMFVGSSVLDDDLINTYYFV